MSADGSLMLTCRDLVCAPVWLPEDKNSSLHGLLNKGRTAMSGRKIDSWIRQPLLDPVLIGQRSTRQAHRSMQN